MCAAATLLFVVVCYCLISLSLGCFFVCHFYRLLLLSVLCKTPNFCDLFLNYDLFGSSNVSFAETIREKRIYSENHHTTNEQEGTQLSSFKHKIKRELNQDTRHDTLRHGSVI